MVSCLPDGEPPIVINPDRLAISPGAIGLSAPPPGIAADINDNV